MGGDSGAVTKNQKRKHLLIKALLASILAGVLLWYTVPKSLDYLERSDPIDSGKRALVIISIPATLDITGVAARWELLNGGEAQLAFYLSKNRSDVIDGQVSLTLITGDNSSKISCIQGDSKDDKIRNLDAGTIRAAQVDAVSGNDATGVLTDRKAEDVDSNTVNLSLSARAYNFHQDGGKDFTNLPGVVEHCKFPTETIWKDSGVTSTALVPEVDVVRSDVDSLTNSNTFLELDMYVSRRPGEIVAESYPALSGSSARNLKADIDAYGMDNNHIIYSASPLIIISNRSTSKADNIFLTIAGISYGLVGALALSVLNALYDVTLGRRTD